MQIGVKVGPALERDALARAAREAERAGFDSIWLSERVVTPLDRPHPYQPMVDPWIGLAFCAAITERVAIGTSVSQVALRHPVLMARELATLDRLSNGRLIVGAGAGWVVEEFASTGVPFETRGGRLTEHIRAMRHLWNEPGKPFAGKYFRIPPVGITPPLTPGGPPIYLGAVLPPGFRRAAKYGDGYISTNVTPDQVKVAVARLSQLRARYGRAGTFAVCVQVSPPRSVEDARALVESYAAAGATGLILTYDSPVPDAFLEDAGVTETLLKVARRS